MTGRITKLFVRGAAGGWCHLLGGMLMFGVVASGQAQVPLVTEELKRLDTWAAFYYENPQPDALPGWISDTSASGRLEKISARQPFMIFVSEVARRHPDKVAGWCDDLATLPLPHMGLVAWAFKNAGASDYRRCTTGMPAVVRDKLRQTTPYSPLAKAPTQPAELDALWAVFMAGGEDAPVNMIIDVLERPVPEPGEPGRLGTMLLQSAAKWSLGANVRRHGRVKALVLLRYQEASGRLREELGLVLNKQPGGSRDAARPLPLIADSGIARRSSDKLAVKRPMDEV